MGSAVPAAPDESGQLRRTEALGGFRAGLVAFLRTSDASIRCPSTRPGESAPEGAALHPRARSGAPRAGLDHHVQQPHRHMWIPATVPPACCPVRPRTVLVAWSVERWSTRTLFVRRSGRSWRRAESSIMLRFRVALSTVHGTEVQCLARVLVSRCPAMLLLRGLRCRSSIREFSPTTHQALGAEALGTSNTGAQRLRVAMPRFCRR